MLGEMIVSVNLISILMLLMVIDIQIFIIGHRDMEIITQALMYF